MLAAARYRSAQAPRSVVNMLGILCTSKPPLLMCRAILNSCVKFRDLYTGMESWTNFPSLLSRHPINSETPRHLMTNEVYLLGTRDHRVGAVVIIKTSNASCCGRGDTECFLRLFILQSSPPRKKQKCLENNESATRCPIPRPRCKTKSYFKTKTTI